MLDINQFKPEPEHRFYGPGFVCGHLQITPDQLAVVMENTGTRFKKIIDGVPFLDGHGFLAVADKCNEVRGEIENAAAAIPNN